jgi:hypothetical protein
MKNKKRILYLAVIILIVTGFVVFWGNKYNESRFTPKKEEIPATTQNQDRTKIFFATDGKNSVYKIKKENKWTVIWNGQEGKLYDSVSNPIFSSDGSQLAYVAQNGNQIYVVINNTQEINAYQSVTYLVFNQNGTQIAFVSVNNNASVVITANVTNGNPALGENITESQAYQNIISVTDPSGNEVSIIYSPDGTDVVYIVQENGETYVVVNGEQGTTGYDSITEVYYNDEGQLVYVAQEGDTTITVIDNQVVPTTDTDTSSDSQTGTPTDNNTTSNTDTGSSNNSSTNKKYRYKPSTTKDINNNTEMPNCTAGNCNF